LDTRRALRIEIDGEHFHAHRAVQDAENDAALLRDKGIRTVRFDTRTVRSGAFREQLACLLQVPIESIPLPLWPQKPARRSKSSDRQVDILANTSSG
jgi:hypothetical protein